MEIFQGEIISIKKETDQTTLARGLVLARSFLKKSVKPSTRNQYDRIYQIWRTFCVENGLPEFEAGHEAVAACLSNVMADKSLSTASMLAAAIANEHRANLKRSPTGHESIAQLFWAFRLCPHKTRDPVKPLKDDLIQKLTGHLFAVKHGSNAIKAPLVIWRTVWRVVMEYHTLGRWSDIGKLKRQNLSFVHSPSLHLKVSFSEGKTQKFNETDERIVAADLINPTNCPVQLTQKYLRFLGSSYTGYMVPACDPKGKPDQNKFVP